MSANHLLCCCSSRSIPLAISESPVLVLPDSGSMVVQWFLSEELSSVGKSPELSPSTSLSTDKFWVGDCLSAMSLKYPGIAPGTELDSRMTVSLSLEMIHHLRSGKSTCQIGANKYCITSKAPHWLKSPRAVSEISLVNISGDSR